MDNWFNLIPVLLILAASLAMLVFDEWQRSIVALAILYLGVFILLVQLVPLTLSAVKLITGWAAALILGLNLPKGESTTAEGLFSNRIFKALSLVLIWVLAFLVSKSISSSFQISPEIVFSALAIFGAGLLQLGMKFRPFSIILGILTVFAGFELLYASVETSVLINGLLSAMNLLIALIGSYFAGFNQIEERS
jgi:hypothetical protein